MEHEHDYQQCMSNFNRIFEELKDLNQKFDGELKDLNKKLVGNGQAGLITKVALHDDYIEQDKIHKAEDREDKRAMARSIKGSMVANVLTVVLVLIAIITLVKT